MLGDEKEYLKINTINLKIVRVEIWLAPLLILVPVVVSCFMVWDWYTRGLSLGNSAFDAELMLAMVILIGNILFDIPFIKSLLVFKRR